MIFSKMKLGFFVIALALGVSAPEAQVAQAATKKAAKKATAKSASKSSARSAPKSAPAAEPPPPSSGGADSVEGRLQSLSSDKLMDVNSRRDPFIAATPPFQARKDLGSDEIVSSAPVLERYPINKYEVVATLLGDQYPRALLRLPQEEHNKVVIVKEKDRLGNRGGTVRKILKDGVAVVQAERSSLGFVDKVETVLKVGVSDRVRQQPASGQSGGEIRQGVPAPMPNNYVRDANQPQAPAPGGSQLNQPINQPMNSGQGMPSEQ